MEPDDAVATCPHRPPCAGCPRFGEPGIASVARDALDRLALAHRLPAVTVVSGTTAGFRLRARLAIRGRVNSPKIGLFESGSHRVVHIPQCSVQHPLINRVAVLARRALVEAGITSYSDKAGLGLARYLQVVVERSSQTAQVVLVGNSATADPFAECFELLRDRLGGELHSLWFNANGGQGNTIMGPDFERWCGPASVVERFGGASVHYPPGAFGQNNLGMAQAIIEHLRAQIPEGASVTEFYAGVGAIGLSVLERAGEIRMNEVSPHALHGLALGLAGLEPAHRARITLISGSAGAACEAAAGSRVVIADPPRKGLDRELTEYLRDHPPERFLYVSCGLESFLADTAQLTARGTLRLASLSAFDLLPFTEHVETVGRFERA
jgi:tRNA/tmRNA/rRNA uracil-C5-methylase (TrmA/RlmC/RlmD family)